MNNREDKIIEALAEDVKIPEIVQRKADEAFAAIKKESCANAVREDTYTRGRMPRKKVYFLAAAAVLAFGTISVGAAAYMQWSKGLSEGLKAEESQMRTLEDENMATPVSQSVTDQGITVTAQQTIVDNYFVHLSFKVEGYELPEGAEPAFEFSEALIDGEEGNYSALNASFYDGTIRGEDGKAVYADNTPLPADGNIEKYVIEDGSMEYDITLANPREKGYFIGKPIHVELANLGTASKAEFIPDIEGTWAFDWVLGGSDESKTVSLDYTLGDTGAVVKEAEISPISLRATLDFSYKEEELDGFNENGEEITSTTFAEPPSLVGVKMKDGTLYPYLYRGPGSYGYMSDEDKENGIYTTVFGIDRILEPDQVESLLFIKSTPEGDTPLTEDDLYIVPIN